MDPGYFDLYGDFIRLNLTIGNSLMNFLGAVFTLSSAATGMSYISKLAKIDDLAIVSFCYPGYFLIIASILLFLESLLFWISGIIYKLELQVQFNDSDAIDNRSLIEKLFATILRDIFLFL